MSSPYDDDPELTHRELGTGQMLITPGRPFIHFGTQSGEFVWVKDKPKTWLQRVFRR